LSAPLTQRLKREPCLNEASHSRKKSDSDTPMRRSVSRMLGQVPSPTPIGADVGRFDQRDLQAAGCRCRDQAGRQPAGGTAAYDHDTSQHVGPYYVMGYENFNRKRPLTKRQRPFQCPLQA
jgi:hypothetical protein